MVDDKFKTGEQVSQKLFEITGDPRFHNLRRGFEDLRNQQDNQSTNQSNQGREN